VKSAIVTGISGQDGTYLARHLCGQGYEVIGLVRDDAAAAGIESEHRLPEGVRLVPWDIRDQDGLEDLLREIRPAEFYNLAAAATGSGMYDAPAVLGDTNGIAVARMLEAIRAADPAIRFCQASSSEIFGASAESPQREDTPVAPRNPYGAAKAYAHSMIGIYRRHYGLFATSAILFNHESPLRSEAFVTRKVTRAAAAIRLGLADTLALGNLDARRDWGFAGDYVRAMWLMLQAGAAADYVVATGQTHSVRELCALAFGHVGLDYRDHVREERGNFRAEHGVLLVGDAAKAERELGWSATTGFGELIGMMVEADLRDLGGTSDTSD
jgi:GDPmannose 4,6-dehydratase